MHAVVGVKVAVTAVAILCIHMAYLHYLGHKNMDELGKAR